MRTLIALLMLTTAAHAESVWTNTLGLNTVATCRTQDETWFEMGTVCHSDKTFRQKPPLITGESSGGAITGRSMPDCEVGWSPVLDASAQPMCARELRKPK